MTSILSRQQPGKAPRLDHPLSPDIVCVLPWASTRNASTKRSWMTGTRGATTGSAGAGWQGSISFDENIPATAYWLQKYLQDGPPTWSVVYGMRITTAVDTSINTPDGAFYESSGSRNHYTYASLWYTGTFLTTRVSFAPAFVPGADRRWHIASICSKPGSSNWVARQNNHVCSRQPGLATYPHTALLLGTPVFFTNTAEVTWAFLYVYNRCLEADDIAELVDDPYVFCRARRPYSFGTGAAAGGNQTAFSRRRNLTNGRNAMVGGRDNSLIGR